MSPTGRPPFAQRAHGAAPVGRDRALVRVLDAGKQRSPILGLSPVTTLLTDKEWSKWSDREIARRCAVSEHTVASVRGSLTAQTRSDPSAPTERTYTTKHGVGKSSLATPVANDDGKLQHSCRAIAGALGVGVMTAYEDVKSAVVRDRTADLHAEVTGIDGKVKPLLEAEARERQRAAGRAPAHAGRGSRSLATSVAELPVRRANDLAGATVGVSGKGAALLTACLRAAPEMAVAPASPGPPLSLVCLWRVEGRRVDH